MTGVGPGRVAVMLAGDSEGPERTTHLSQSSKSSQTCAEGIVLKVYGRRLSFRKSFRKNQKAMLVNALKNVNWADLYYLKYCKEQCYVFDQVMTNLTDTCFPTKTVALQTLYKPWV